ncbi:MAG: SAM-dependent methyltransferase [Lachnospira sp.]
MTIEELLEQCIQKNLIDLTISGLKKKNEELPVKIKVRPVAMKDKIEYQVSEFIGRKVFHKNYKKDELKKKITDWMQEDYKQAQFTMTDATAQILSGKHSQTVKYKKCKEVRVQRDLSHNRTKRYILPEGTPVGFLIDLGVMTKEGKIVRQKYDKYRQINRFLEFVEDILPQLSKEREQTIIDFGCGKSYLTFAMYYYLKELKGYDIRIIGLDLKEDVIAHCNELKDKYGYGKLSFLVGDIASYTDVDAVDMVVTLHACDTATDYALAKAVQWGAKVILSVPCCQHEANRMMENELLQPVLQYGILKERMAAIMTDAVRANLLTAKGYDTQILEFIDMEHTPKNLLIRAVYTGKDSENAAEALKNMEEALHLNLTLNKLLGQ